MIEAGTVLQNRYLIERQIGQGGMGTVYIATDQRFGSTVAVKETIFTDQNLRKAFEREAQLLNSLRHPALPRVSDHFIEGDGQFIVMEYIAGDDLFDMAARRGAFAVADVLKWADQLLDALNYLHTQKMPVVHRDIKPQNLKLTPRGDIVLLDFGLAKGSASELSQLTMAKSVFGYSRSYAPLEQIQGTGTDPRSDIYSLAATLYHLLSGKPPIDALTRATAVLSADADPLTPLHQLNPKVPPAVSQILHQAMALNPKARPASAAQMRFALSEAAAQPFEEQTFTAVEAFPVSAEVFTQNTQIMNAAQEDGKTAVLRTAADTNLDAALTNAGTQAENDSEDATKISRRGMVVNVPQNSSQIAAEGSFVPRRRSYVAAKAFAAAIVFLGGIALAFYNINAVRSNVGETTPQKENFVTEERNNGEAKTGEIKNSETTVQTNNPAAETVVQANVAADAQNSTLKNPVISAQPEAERNAPAKDKQAQIAQKNPQQKADVWTVEGTPLDPDDLEDLKNLNKDIQEELQNAKVNVNVINTIPPEIRSNDPRNPVDQEKLKNYIKKMQNDARQKQLAEREKWREQNRMRREQGLPPLEFPTAPKPPKVVMVQPPNTQPHPAPTDKP